MIPDGGRGCRLGKRSSRSIRSFAVNRKGYARSSRGWKRGLRYSTRGFIAPLGISREEESVRARRTRNRGYVHQVEKRQACFASTNATVSFESPGISRGRFQLTLPLIAPYVSSDDFG